MALIKYTVPLPINEGPFSKASAPPLFLEDENTFQKSARMVQKNQGLKLNIDKVIVILRRKLTLTGVLPL
jgi:hypothetical protein